MLTAKKSDGQATEAQATEAQATDTEKAEQAEQQMIDATEQSDDQERGAEFDMPDEWDDRPLPRRKKAQATEGDGKTSDASEGETESRAIDVADHVADHVADDEASSWPGEVEQRLVERVREKIPGSAVGSVDELIDQHVELNQVLNEYAALEELAAKHEGVVAFFTALKEGKTAQDAAAEAFGGLQITAPDPHEDPEGYADWKVEQDRKKREAEEAQQKAQQNQGRQGQIAEQATSLFEQYVKREGLGQDEATKFLAEYRTLLGGDPHTGRLRGDLFDVIYRGLHHERLVNEAIDEAKIEGRNEGIDEVKNRHRERGDGLPKPKSDGGPAPERTPEQRERENMRRRFANDGDVSDLLGLNENTYQNPRRG